MDFLGGSFRIGRLFDINIRVHILFALWIAFQLFDAGAAWRFQALFLAMLFGIVLLHELGHCLAARTVGGDAHDILMWPLGGLAFAHAPMTPWAQFVTVAGGPLVNVVFCAATALMLIGVTGDPFVVSFRPFGFGNAYPQEWIFYAQIFFRVNYSLLLFNLLPIYPLDGGQLFFTIIWPWLGIRRATILACQIGLAGAVLLGMWGMSASGPRMMIGIALFGGLTCLQRMRMAQMGQVFDERIGTYNWVSRGTRYRRSRGWLSRIFGPRAAPAADHDPNPNPGGWQARLARERADDDEVDRILKKVHERGVNSLSYVERQTLERATRERRDRDSEVERHERY
ncbi:MAG: site-2 protease family protein [Phycisphaerae bacterium]